MRWLLPLLAALVLASCGDGGSGDEPEKPRKLEVVSFGKDEVGDELDPEELAGLGDTLWMTIDSSVASADGATGKLKTQPQEVPGNPILYDIGAGDAGVWV